jgi:hypothetical protein
MVRTYKRKTHQGEWSAENMSEAADKVLRKELTLRRAAEVYNVPFTSLQRRVTLSRGVIKRRGGKTVFKNAQGNKKVNSKVKAGKTGPRKTHVQIKKKNKATPKLKVKGHSSSREWHCIYCSEAFVHPPVEDWIQCHVCEEWCHENCADRGGAKGLYECDLCSTNDN